MSKFFRVRVVADTSYDIKANSKKEAIWQAEDYFYDGYVPHFDVEEISEEDYEGA